MFEGFTFPTPFKGEGYSEQRAIIPGIFPTAILFNNHETAQGLSLK